MLNVMVGLAVQMRKTNFITVKEFALRHEMTPSNVHVCKHNGIVPDCSLSYDGRSYLIDEAYFLRRDAFVRSVYIEAQNNYFAIHDILNSNSAISRLIIALGGTRSFLGYTQFMADSLFVNKPRSILCTRICFTMWEFWRISRWLVKIIYITGFTDEKSIMRYILDRD